MTLLLILTHFVVMPAPAGAVTCTPRGGASAPRFHTPRSGPPLVRGVRVVAGAGAEGAPCLTRARARAYVPAPQILPEYSP